MGLQKTQYTEISSKKKPPLALAMSKKAFGTKADKRELEKVMLETASAIDASVLEGNFGHGTIQRGRQYYQAGRVSDIYIAEKSSRITASVRGRGRNLYRTEIDLFKNERGDTIVDGKCTCPVGFNCKHIVATLLEIQEKWQRPTALLSSSHTISGEREATGLSTELNQWFDGLQSALDNDRQIQPATNAPYHLLYVLKPRLYQGKKLEVSLQLSRVLKKGGYGKPKKYSSTARAQQAYLQAADKEIMMGLQFLNKRSFFGAQSDASIFLEGPQSSKWLEAMLNTGRCFWENAPNQPMIMGDAKALELSWVLLPNAYQTLQLSIDNAAADIFILDQPWYINKANGACGLAKTGISVNVVEKLLEAPEVPPEATKEISQQMKALIPDSTQFLPKELNKPIRKKNINPVPEIHLNVELVQLSNRNAYYPAEQAVERPIAEISFSYAGKRVFFSIKNRKDTITYVEDGIVYAIQRNLEKEKAHLLELSERIQLRVLDRLPEIDKPTKLAILSIQGEDDFLQFVLYTLPQLECNGWHIIRQHEAFLQVVYEEEVSWYSELEEVSSYDYFGFKMGIIIDGEKINMLPIIANIIKSTPAESFKAFADDQVIPLSLPNGKILSVPYSRIKPILNVLIELYDTALKDSDSIKLSTRQAALLYEIEKAFSASQLRWFGGKKLRGLGKKLSHFKSVKIVRPPTTFKATLRPYQQDGVNWLQFLREFQMGGILADDMGLGKTVQMLAHLSIEKNKRRMKKPSLIIAPTSLMVNWRLEAKKFTPNLKVLVYHGDHRHIHRDTFAEYDIVLTTYPLLVRDKERLLSKEYYYLILDEAQFIKNHRAKSTQIVQQIKAEYRLCMTGTPMENHLGELWSLFHFLMPGFLGDAKQFKRLFRTPIEKHDDADRRKGLVFRIKPFMLRRQKEEVLKDLPEKTCIVRRVELQGPERDLYESIRLSMEKKVRAAIKQNGLARSQIIILDALLKLRQTCCHPRLLKLASAQKARMHSTKMTLLTEMLPKMVEEGRKILLFSQFTTMLAIIEEMLKKEGLDYVKLTGSTKNRAKPIEIFQQGKASVFLISLKAGGTGLNLTAADTVIHYDPWWNPAVEDQATDRAHRIGQKKPVFVYKLLASGTVEETIQEMQQKKRQLMKGLFSDYGQGKVQLSSEDLSNLFKPLPLRGDNVKEF
jgi:SNF2 family DNA or RNA helicase